MEGISGTAKKAVRGTGPTDGGRYTGGYEKGKERGRQIGTPSIFCGLICPKVRSSLGALFLAIQSYLNSLVQIVAIWQQCLWLLEGKLFDFFCFF
ncbi:hypothetical protein X474_05860 [Dethiosulfatarculus sandiegensis]|uniref:Uncharacterized protein n=1 Tax=Dethiosulfatarculus sandiegensis TaxID=1429043 RepID=A0A0D2JH46_9BACT|nr:hypothetical protein X474_05860 [Dethiosulfatarculus sandiegensis]